MAKKAPNQKLYEALAERLNKEIPRPCPFWVWIDVRTSPAPPSSAPSLDLEHATSTALDWLANVDPARNLRAKHPAFVGMWSTGFAITFFALNRPEEAFGSAPVPLPHSVADFD